MNVAIIPAKGKSTRIPSKNFRLFDGKPMLVYSIEAARNSRLFQRIFVSTDHWQVAEIAEKNGAEVIKRPARLTEDDVGTQAVMAHALSNLPKRFGILPIKPEYVCCIYATCPLLLPRNLQRGFDEMLRQGTYAYVPGWYYWGQSEWFSSGKALSDGRELTGERGRYIDINTPEDLKRAEEMLATLKREAA